MVIVDIWGGFESQDHVARFHRQVDDALELAKAELEAGFLVNLRIGENISFPVDFDDRKKKDPQ